MFNYREMTVTSLKAVGIFLAGTATMMFSSCGDNAQQQAQAPQIATMTVAYGSSNLESAYPATIKGRTDIAIRPQVTGFITKVHVDEGQQVRKGQALFTLDQVQYEAAVESAKAAVNVAKAAVSTAQLTADNKKMLFEKNIISEYEWQMAENSLAQAKAQLAQAEAGLVNAQKNLAYTVVTAPCDGVIGSIPNREGSLASPSSTQALTTVSDNSEVYAYFSLNEKDILSLTGNGAKTLNTVISEMPEVKLQLADGSTYNESGKVATISGVIDNTTGAVNVRALFNNKTGLLRSGSTGLVLIPHSVDSALIIPQKATFEIQNLRYVYVVNDSNKTTSTKVEIMEQNDGKNFIVKTGLKPGDRIVIEGVGVSVKDGMAITPTEANAQQ